MNVQNADVRIAVLSDNGIERDARVLKEIAWLEERFAQVDSFSLRQRGEAPIDEKLLGHTRFRAAYKTMSKGQAQAALAGVPSLRTGHPPEFTRRRAGFASIAFFVTSIGLGAWSGLGGVPSWLFLASTVLTVVLASIACWIWAKERQLKRITEISPKTGEAIPILEPYSSHYKQSQALMNLVDGTIRRDGPYDIIHTHELVALETGAKIKRRYGGKLIWDTHEVYEDMAEPDPGLAAVAAKIIREATPDIDAVITVNDSIGGYYRETHPDLPPATIVMNATPRCEVPEDDGRLRNAARVDQDVRILLFQGGLTIHRGLQALVRSAADYREDWALVILGAGQLKDELTGIADQVNRETGQRRVCFLPAVPNAELAKWTVGADLGVIPYENVALNHWFCSPNKLWEYPAAGVPFIAPRHHFIAQMVEKYRTGFLFESDFGAKDISDAVNAIGDEELTRARSAIPAFLDEMSWENFTPKLEAVYDALLTDCGGRSRL